MKHAVGGDSVVATKKDAVMPATLTIPARFNGPPRSGNGGYSCGALADFIPGAAQVRLNAPPPLDTPLEITETDGGVRALAGDTIIAEGRPAAEPRAVPPHIPARAVADGASKTFIGHEKHIFPTCFVCGPDRAEGDGLRIFPGAVEGGDIVAATWTPDATLVDAAEATIAARHVWAALDCPSFFAFQRDDLMAVLAQMTAIVRRRPAPGEACVIVAWPTGSVGRKHRSASALVDHAGAVIAQAEALWIEMRAQTAAAVGAKTARTA